MTIGVSTSAYLHFDLGDALHRISGLGIDQVELWGEPPHMFHETWQPQHVKELKRSMDSLGMSCTLHAPGHDVDISSMNPGIWRESLNQYLETLQVAHMLEAKVVVIHGGSYYPGDAPNGPTGKDRLYRALDVLIPRAEGLGVHVALENYPLGPTSVVGSAAAFRQVIDDFDSRMFGATLDVGHAFVNGEDPLDYIDAVSRRLKHVHLNDNDGDEDSHLPLGEGKVDFEQIFQQLKRSDFRGSYAIEVWAPEDPDRAIQASHKHVRQLLDARRAR